VIVEKILQEWRARDALQRFGRCVARSPHGAYPSRTSGYLPNDRYGGEAEERLARLNGHHGDVLRITDEHNVLLENGRPFVSIAAGHLGSCIYTKPRSFERKSHQARIAMVHRNETVSVPLQNWVVNPNRFTSSSDAINIMSDR
jgi:hypothetical protein